MPTTAQQISRGVAGGGRLRLWTALVAVLVGLVGGSYAPEAATAAPAQERIQQQAGPPANLDDYWNGTASWSLEQYWSQQEYGATVNDAFGAGPTITIGPDGVWNWFYRTVQPAHYQPPEAERHPCTGADTEFTLSGTVLRRSTDKGASWTAASAVVLPTLGTYWACQATDGGAIWDNDRWYYVFQCLRSQSEVIWRGCLATNTSPDPTLGTWVTEAEPIIGDDIGARLWDQICDQPSDDCVEIPNNQTVRQNGVDKVGAAGTFNLFRSPEDPGWIYMDFHGVDTSMGYQYMGVAKTQDFHTWYAGGGFNLPVDAVYDRLDALSWREPAGYPLWDQELLHNAGEEIGGGGNAIFADPVTKRYYNIGDASNNPTCANTTVFDQGILRSDSLTNTTWEQPTAPGRENPFLYSQQTLLSEEQLPNRCGPAYVSFFNDPTTGETYMLFFGRSSERVKGNYLFKLTHNVLANGDAARCVDVAPWRLSQGGTAGVDFTVWRDGNWASDNMCYFAFTKQISQDVPLATDRAYTSVTWGGSFSARLSAAMPPMGYQSQPDIGTLTLTLTQLDASGVTLSEATQVVPVTGDYSKPATTTALDAAAAGVRYTVTPSTPGPGRAVLADEMFVRPELANTTRLKGRGRPA